MISEQVIYKFRNFDPITHFIIAPEGLSRFYAKGFSGEVLATWMTTRDRLHEIEDFSDYLSHLYTTLSIQRFPNAKKILLGFSQGGTVAFRWLHARKVDFDYFIAYSCWIPEDINFQTSKTVLGEIKLIYTYGSEDKFLTTDIIKKIAGIAKKNKLTMEIEKYEGTHRIDIEQLTKIFLSFIQAY
jgi:predicted esterase